VVGSCDGDDRSGRGGTADGFRVLSSKTPLFGNFLEGISLWRIGPIRA
jgi:hypothetical protein